MSIIYNVIINIVGSQKVLVDPCFSTSAWYYTHFFLQNYKLPLKVFYVKLVEVNLFGLNCSFYKLDLNKRCSGTIKILS